MWDVKVEPSAQSLDCPGELRSAASGHQQKRLPSSTCSWVPGVPGSLGHTRGPDVPAALHCSGTENPWVLDKRGRAPYGRAACIFGSRVGSGSGPGYNWADLGGLIFIICLFIFLRSVPTSPSAHDWDLALVSGADFWRNLHYFSSRGRSRGSRGPPWARRGRKSAKNKIKNPGPYLS